LKVKSEVDPKFIQEVIYGGHYWALDWEMPGIFHQHKDKRETVSEVVDILDMWSFLEDGFNQLSAKEKARVASEAKPFGTQVKFRGFDGNNETEHMGVARFLVEKMDRFVKFKGRDLNAHIGTLETHKRMLTVFEPIRITLMGRDLNASEIIVVLKAMLHPDRG